MSKVIPFRTAPNEQAKILPFLTVGKLEDVDLWHPVDAMPEAMSLIIVPLAGKHGTVTCIAFELSDAVGLAERILAVWEEAKAAGVEKPDVAPEPAGPN